MKLSTKLFICLLILAHFLNILVILNQQYKITQIIFTILFLIVLDVFSLNLINKSIRTSNYALDEVIRFQKNLREKYGTKLKSDLYNIFYYIRNKSLFNFLLIEPFQSSLQLELKSKYKFMRKEKGWLSSFRSSEKALRRFNNLYKQLFENQLKFQISYLITLLSIKNKFYNEIQKNLENGKILVTENDISKRVLNQILINLREGYNFSIYKEKFPIFCIQEFKTTLPTDKNLMNFKRKFVNYLKRLNASINESNAIKKIVNRIYSKIKYRYNYVIPPEIITIFQDMPLDEFKEMYSYKNFFMSILDYNLNDKLEYLKIEGYDFNDWINKDLRDKFVHDLDIFYIKMGDGLCGAKIVLGKNRNEIFSVEKYYNSLCKLKALCNFLYNHNFRVDQYNSNDFANYQLSNVKLMKVLQKNNFNFPKI
ncbi:MAG: hypothetical protein ACFFCE_01770 [Promethearchaeota archaeon]